MAKLAGKAERIVTTRAAIAEAVIAEVTAYIAVQMPDVTLNEFEARYIAGGVVLRVCGAETTPSSDRTNPNRN